MGERIRKVVIRRIPCGWKANPQKELRFQNTQLRGDGALAVTPIWLLYDVDTFWQLALFSIIHFII